MFKFFRKPIFDDGDLDYAYRSLSSQNRKRFYKLSEETRAIFADKVKDSGSTDLFRMWVAVRKGGKIHLLSNELVHILNKNDYSSAFKISSMISTKRCMENYGDHQFQGNGPNFPFDLHVKNITNECALKIVMGLNKIPSR